MARQSNPAIAKCAECGAKHLAETPGQESCRACIVANRMRQVEGASEHEIVVARLKAVLEMSEELRRLTGVIPLD